MGQVERHVASRDWPAGRVHTASLNGAGVAARLAHGSRLAAPASASFLIVYTRGGTYLRLSMANPATPGPRRRSASPPSPGGGRTDLLWPDDSHPLRHSAWLRDPHVRGAKICCYSQLGSPCLLYFNQLQLSLNTKRQLVSRAEASQPLTIESSCQHNLGDLLTSFDATVADWIGELMIKFG